MASQDVVEQEMTFREPASELSLKFLDAVKYVLNTNFARDKNPSSEAMQKLRKVFTGAYILAETASLLQMDAVFAWPAYWSPFDGSFMTLHDRAQTAICRRVKLGMLSGLVQINREDPEAEDTPIMKSSVVVN